MIRVTPLLGGVVAVLLVASATTAQTPQLLVEPPRPTSRLTPQPQTVEPPASLPQPTAPPASQPIVVEEVLEEDYSPILMPPPPPPPLESGRKHRRKHANAKQTAPVGAVPYAPGPYGNEGFADGFSPSPYGPPPPPATGRKHRWRHTPPNKGVGDPALYGNGELAEGNYYTPVGPPPPPNGPGKKNRWKRGNPDLSYYPIPGADMMDDGLNAFTDPNCLKKKHHHLHGMLHKHHAAKKAVPPAPIPPQPCLEEEIYFPSGD